MDPTEIQKALDQMADSIDTERLGRVMEAQINPRTGPVCRKCGKIVKNLRGLSAHDRTHRP